MISEETYSQVRGLVEVRELDRIIVKGREEPVTVYQLLGNEGEVEAERLELRDHFEGALARYRDREWNEAIERFEQIIEEHPDDEPSRVMLERVRQYRDNPPSEDWNGAFRLTSK
jgi:adenylate cyclase